MAISDKKLAEMDKAARDYLAWLDDNNQSYDSAAVAAFAEEAAVQIKKLVPEVKRLKEFEWKYNDLCK